MSGNLWMFSDMLDDEDIEMQKHDFITLYQGADYYGLGLKVFTRMAREAGSVYKIGKKALIRRTIFDEYLRKVYKKELEKNSSDDSGKELMKRQGTMVTDEDSGRMDIRFGFAVLKLKERYPDIRLILVLPCFSQTRGWSQEDIEIYDDIKQKADKVVYTSQEYTRGCMHKRNRHLVDNSSACISYLTENKGGTFYTVNYAKSKGVEVINIAE